MAYKIVFTSISLGFGLATFLPYYINIARKKTKPHIFSWINWAFLTGLGFVLSLTNGGGEGAWIFGLQSAACLGIAVWALFKKEKNIVRIDVIIFGAAIIITFFYVITKNAIISVALAAIIDCLGFVPTFRKSYLKPFDETALTYFLSFLSFLFSILALQSYNFVTMFYPLVLLITNNIFVVFLLVRRKTMARIQENNL
jgi:hypothetical protein